MNITKFLNDRGFHQFEGYSQQVSRQVDDLIELSKKEKICVMEIGFNAGHSSEVFLKNNPTLNLTSFDLGCHEYVSTAKEYIDVIYPNRQTLILGDSTVTIPKYIQENPDKKFDLIFIDGGHTYEIAKADLENCRKLATKDTVVAIDDTIYTKGWVQHYTIGPTQTWVEHLNAKKITEIHRVDYEHGRGMSWGKYIF
jgi:predicted O-methyltransferase YrrM